jgi:hypothetical protein
VKQIERELGVSRASVSMWVRDIVLDETQRKKLERQTTVGQLRAAELKADERDACERSTRPRAADSLPRGGGNTPPDACSIGRKGARPGHPSRYPIRTQLCLRSLQTFSARHLALKTRNFSAYCNLFADHVRKQREIEQFG